MIILGLNAYHANASAAIMADGRLLAAVEEERLNRVKYAAGLPEAAPFNIASSRPGVKLRRWTTSRFRAIRGRASPPSFGSPRACRVSLSIERA